MGSIRKQLEISRMELLDMGIRGNTLLHFRATAKTLAVVDEQSNEIYQRLVEQQQAMSFIPLAGVAPDVDSKLQTKLNSDLLDKRLLKISTEANSYYQEQGVDILYLALGFLSWYEDSNSTKLRQAPLILVPVKLARGSATERFKLLYTQADLGPNLTLASKLKMDFEINLPKLDDELNVEQYFADIECSIESQPRWQLNRDHVALGFFSFGKFQMYQDLDPDTWPQSHQPEQHPVLESLLGEGFTGAEASLLPMASAETTRKPLDLTDFSFVKDADSSQTAAILGVKNGASLVIQGPPGTGKSQTISNIISQSLADNKTVLFVAEKMAALEVVKSRLDDCQLGDAVLELHSHKSNKKVVLAELQRTLELGVPAVEDSSTDKARHRLLQQKLDRYCREVNTPILNSGINYIDALGYSLKIEEQMSGQTLPALDFELMREWDGNDFEHACTLLQPLVSHLEEMGTPAKHLFARSSLEAFSPGAQEQLLRDIQRCTSLLSDCRTQIRVLAEHMGLSSPSTVNDIESLCTSAQYLLTAPGLGGLNLSCDEWLQNPEQINSLIADGNKISMIKASRADSLIDQAWTADLLPARQAMATSGQHWWRALSSDYRHAKSNLEGLLIDALPRTNEGCIALLDDILKVQSTTEHFQQYSAMGERLFATHWCGLETDWNEVQALSDWVIDFYRQQGKNGLTAEALRFLEHGEGLVEGQRQLDELVDTCAELQQWLANIVSQLQLAPLEDGGTLADESLPALQQRLRGWSRGVGSLYQVTRYNSIGKVLRNKKLATVETLAYDWELPPGLLLTALKKSWYDGLLNEAYDASVSIKSFDRINHENIITEFKDLDRELFHYAQESLVEQHYRNLPHSRAAGENGILRHELSKVRRHMPLRRLLKEAGKAVQQIKPVFMMSPMSAATYLEQGAIEFDLVIFDEASQIKVADAIGPILRGKQVVVVGDTRQMPPTDFFRQSLELDEEETELSQTADIESILNMFISKGAPEAMLRWHYRSRHDSLITVSNQEFYDGKLMIFPSPGVNAQAKGLSFNHVSEAIYERGSSRTSPIEARVVAEAVIRYARSTPQQSLGVVAFSTAQRDCILQELEGLRRDNPDCEPFFNHDRFESFFVKNLENVQGDERDTIFISIGYGRTVDGRVSKSFGPINREGGERRLNVLITRARLAMEVFCNFTADELETDASSPFGVRALKSFIHYAESGDLVNHGEPPKVVATPFEDKVIEVIRSLGYAVVAKLGSAGFAIDIAVCDPSHPGRYLLAIETDGVNYNSGKNARDRDRLRQSVLEGLGWRCHRIWSTDWFRGAMKETERLSEAIEASVRYYRQLDEGVAESSKTKVEGRAHAPVTRLPAEYDELLVPLYQLARKDLGIARAAKIHKLDTTVINAAIVNVLEREGPLHIKDLGHRLSDSAGFVRIGPKVMVRIEASVKQGHDEGLFYLDSDFVYRDRDRQVSVRDRSALSSSDRQLDHIPPEELEASLLLAIEIGFSLPAKAAVAEALSLLGFQRKTEKNRLVMAELLKQLLQEGRVEQRGELIILGSQLPVVAVIGS